MSKVLLGDVAHEHKETCKGSKDGYPIVGLEHLIPEEITLTTWDEGSENTFTKMFRKGNVLFGRRRAYLKKAAVAPFNGICSGDITVIEADPDKILPELLPFIIQNDDLFDFAVGKSAGSLSPRVKWEHLKNYEFELPDMDKQKELAELLWAIDDTKKSYQELIAATDELVKSQFMEQFSDEQETILLKKAFELQMGKTPARAEKRLWQSSDHKWISIADMSTYNKYTADTKEYLSDLAVRETGIKIVPKNTVIMSFKLTIGRTAITSEDIYTNEAIMAFIPQKDIFDLEYLRHALSYYDWSGGLQNAVKGATLNKAIIGNVEFPVPSMERQRRFAEFVAQSDKSKYLLQNWYEIMNQVDRRLLTCLMKTTRLSR